MKTALVSWKQGLEFHAQADNGAVLTLDPGHKGFSPKHILLYGLAGCTGMDVISILEKKRIRVTDFQVMVQAAEAETQPRVYTDIEITYILHGPNIPIDAVERAIDLSQTTYCSVSHMLGKAAPIHVKYEIIASNPDA